MSDLVKWGILAAVVVTVVAVVIATGAWDAITGLFADSGVNDIISAGVGAMSSFLIIGRQLLNNFFYPPALTAAIIMSFTMFTVYCAVRVGTFIARFIYK